MSISAPLIFCNILIIFLRSGVERIMNLMLDCIMELPNIGQLNLGNAGFSVDNNTGHVNYAYITTEISARNLSQLHDQANPPPFHVVMWQGQGVRPPIPQPTPQSLQQLNQLRKMLTRDYDALCPTQLPYKCRIPTASIVPDLSINITEQVNTLSHIQEQYMVNWKFAGIIVDLVGKKDVWGHLAESFKGTIAACNGLSFMDRTYLAVIGECTASIYKFERSVDNKIGSTRQDFNFDGTTGNIAATQAQNQTAAWVSFFRTMYRYKFHVYHCQYSYATKTVVKRDLKSKSGMQYC